MISLKRIMLLLPVFLAVSSFFPSLSAQTFNQKIYQAYVKGDMLSWKKALDDFNERDKSQDELYGYALACYGYIGYWIGEQDGGKARKYLDRAEDLSEKLLERNQDNPRYLVLRVALCGFRMDFQPQKAPLLFPKAGKLMSRAWTAGPLCPEVWIEAGNRDWFLPEALGGSREASVESYQKAIQLMEQDPAYTDHNWFYLKTHKLLIERLQQINRTRKAWEACRKILQVEPEFTWARHEMEKLNKLAR